MANYIALVNLTEKGVADAKASPGRLDAARAAFADQGVTLKDVYLTMGRYDIVIVFEADDDADVAKAILKVAGAGNVSTETMRAFDEGEYREIMSSL